MVKITKFLNDIRGSKTIHFTDLYRAYKYNDCKDLQKDLFFVGGVDSHEGSGKAGRVADSDIVSKKYVVVDIDIRSKDNLCTDKELDDKIDEIIALLDGDAMCSEYSYVVNSGNGCHIYYIGDEDMFDIDDYSLACGFVYKAINKVIELSLCECDTAVRNISTVTRLPGSINYKRKKKYDLEPRLVEIIRHQEKNSSFVNLLKSFAEEEKKNIIKAIDIHKPKLKDGSEELFEKIAEINVGDLFAWNKGIERARDGRNFISNKDGKNIGMFYDKETNLLVNQGTRHLESGLAGYNSWSFVKNEILKTSSNKEVVDRFLYQYPELKDYTKKQEKPKVTVEQATNNLVTADHQENTHKDKYFTRGNQEVDEAFGMMSTGDLVVVASFTSQGKTMRCTQIADRNGSGGEKVAYFTLEVSPRKLKKRQGILSAGISKYEYQTKQYTERQETEMKQVEKDFDKNFLLAGFKELPHIDELITNIKNLHEQGYTLFFIDNLDKIKSDDQKDNARQATITSELQNLKNNLPITIVLIHHYNKPKEGELQKAGGLHKVRGNNKIGDDSNIMIEIRRDNDIDSPTNKVWISQYKDTDLGTVGQVELYFDKGKYYGDPARLKYNKKRESNIYSSKEEVF